MIIGLTGGIGSGKSTVAALFAERGCRVVDADAIARDVVAPGTDALRELAEAFGPEILHNDTSLNRGALAKLAFSTPEATARLNAITHPRIEAETNREFAAAEADGQPILWDIPLLVDKGFHKRCDAVVVIDMDPEVRVQRLVAHRGLDEADARRRIRAQIADSQRLAAADFVIDNNAGPEELRPQVEVIANELGLPPR